MSAIQFDIEAAQQGAVRGILDVANAYMKAGAAVDRIEHTLGEAEAAMSLLADASVNLGARMERMGIVTSKAGEVQRRTKKDTDDATKAVKAAGDAADKAAGQVGAGAKEEADARKMVQQTLNSVISMEEKLYAKRKALQDAGAKDPQLAATEDYQRALAGLTSKIESFEKRKVAAVENSAEAKKKARDIDLAELSIFKQQERQAKLVERAWSQGSNQLEKLIALRKTMLTMTSKEVQETPKFTDALQKMNLKIEDVQRRMESNKGRSLSELMDEQRQAVKLMLEPINELQQLMRAREKYIAQTPEADRATKKFTEGLTDLDKKIGEVRQEMATGAGMDAFKDKVLQSLGPVGDMATGILDLKTQFKDFNDSAAKQGTSGGFMAWLKSLGGGKLLLLGLVGAMAAAGVASVQAASKFADQAVEIENAAKFAGIGTDRMSRYQVMQQKLGLQTDEMGEVFAELASKQKDVNDGAEDQVRAFRDLGISVEDLSGRLKDPEVKLKAIAEGFKNAQDRGKATAAIMSIFGDDISKKLAPALAKGSDGIEAMLRKNDELGLSMGQDGVRAAKEYKETMQELDSRVEGLTRTFGKFAAEVINVNLEVLNPKSALEFFGILGKGSEEPTRMVTRNMARLEKAAADVEARMRILSSVKMFGQATPEQEAELALMESRRNMISTQMQLEKGLGDEIEKQSRREVDLRKSQVEALDKVRQALASETADTLEGRAKVRQSLEASSKAIDQETKEAKNRGADTAEFLAIQAQRKVAAEKKAAIEIRSIDKQSSDERKGERKALFDAINTFLNKSVDEEVRVNDQRKELLDNLLGARKKGLISEAEVELQRTAINKAADDEIAEYRSKKLKEETDERKKLLGAIAQGAEKEIEARSKAAQQVEAITRQANAAGLSALKLIEQETASSLSSTRELYTQEAERINDSRKALLENTTALLEKHLITEEMAQGQRLAINQDADAAILAARAGNERALGALQAGGERKRAELVKQTTEQVAEFTRSADVDLMDDRTKLHLEALEEIKRLEETYRKSGLDKDEAFERAKTAVLKKEARARSKVNQKEIEQYADMAKNVMGEVSKLVDRYENKKLDAARQTLSEIGALEEELGGLKEKIEEGKATSAEQARARELESLIAGKERQLEVEKQAALKAFNINKGLSLVQVAIDTAMGIMKAVAQFGPPPSPMGIAGIAAATAIGGIQAGIIAASEPPEIAHTGRDISGPQLSVSGSAPDERPHNLLTGEGVVNRPGMKRLGPDGLHALNTGGSLSGQGPMGVLKIRHKTFEYLSWMSMQSGGEVSQGIRKISNSRAGRRKG